MVTFAISGPLPRSNNCTDAHYTGPITRLVFPSRLLRGICSLRVKSRLLITMRRRCSVLAAVSRPASPTSAALVKSGITGRLSVLDIQDRLRLWGSALISFYGRRIETLF